MMKINGKEVTVKDLTVGDLKQIQKLTAGKAEAEQGVILVSYCINVPVAELDAMPIAAIKDISIVAEHIGKLIEA